MSRALSLRPATVADVPNLARLHVDTWNAAYTGLIPESVLGTLSYEGARKRWFDWLGNSDAVICTVAVDDHALLGFVRAGSDRAASPSVGLGEIQALYVRADAWGRGVGSQLLASGIDSLSHLGFSHSRLWVLSANARAMEFYRKHGWRPDGEERVDIKAGHPLREISLRKDV